MRATAICVFILTAVSYCTCDTVSNVSQYQICVGEGSGPAVHAYLTAVLNGSFLQYTQVNMYTMVGSADQVEAVTIVDGVLSVTLVDPDTKISPDLSTALMTSNNWRRAAAGDADPTVVTLLVLCALDERNMTLSYLIDEWLPFLEAIPGGATATADGHMITVQTGVGESLTNLLAFLKMQPRVQWVEQKPVFSVYNKYATSVVQGGNGSYTPVWSKGLNGVGQIIGVSDTGIDTDSCFFNDDTGAGVPLCPTVVGTGAIVGTCNFNVSARKVVTYRYFGTSPTSVGYDSLNGHGTHVAGICAGSSTNASLSPYNGHAPGAKIAFDDIASTGSTLDRLPSSLLNLFPISYMTGARIYSMSWGDTSFEYTLSSQEIDTYAAQKPDFLMLVAVGNSGPSTRSIRSPSTAKNILSVGASFNTRQSDIETNLLVRSLVVLTPASAAGTEFQSWSSTIGASPMAAETYQGQVVASVPSNACTQPTLGSLTGKIALVIRGVCSFDIKIKFVQLAGASAVLVYNNVLGSAFAMAPANSPATGITIPSVMVSWKNGLDLQAIITAGNNLTVILYTPSFAPGAGYFTRLADFSSQGPTGTDQRNKPDVVCPGNNIVSAQSDGVANSNNCGTRVSSGTSMATPACAGAAAIVRQYYTEGWHVNGSKGATGISPSASLLKATMIQSARIMSYLNQQGRWTNLSATPYGPTTAYGYGLVDLSAVLWFGAESKFQFRHYDYQLVLNGQAQNWCFNTVTSDSNFRVTLVWTDPAGVTTGTQMLIHDLDLTVVDANGVFRYGNNLLQNQETFGWQPVIDVINNVEQVTLVSPADGMITVRVSGVSVVAEAGQNFSLVVTGAYGSSISTGACGVQACPNNCSYRGTCTANTFKCVCTVDWTGADCSLAVPTLRSGVDFVASVSIGAWGYYKWTIEADTGASFVVLITAAGGNLGDGDFYLGYNSKPAFNNIVPSTPQNRDTTTSWSYTSASALSGTYVLAVFGACCGDTASMTLRVTTTGNTLPTCATAPGYIAGSTYCNGTTAVACSACSTSEFVVTACGKTTVTTLGTTTANTVCSSCVAGTNYCNGVSAATCSTCSASQYVSIDCNTTSNTVCASCVAGTTYCNGVSAVACSSCSASQYQVSVCSTTSNTVCVAKGGKTNSPSGELVPVH